MTFSRFSHAVINKLGCRQREKEKGQRRKELKSFTIRHFHSEGREISKKSVRKRKTAKAKAKKTLLYDLVFEFDSRLKGKEDR